MGFPVDFPNEPIEYDQDMSISMFWPDGFDVGLPGLTHKFVPISWRLLNV
jgi:hypothetical protein